MLGASEIGVSHYDAVAYATVMDDGWTERDNGVREAGRQAGRWLDVKQTAEELGISSDAVRKRIARGTLRSGKGEDGSVRVWLDGVDEGLDGDQSDDQPSGWTRTGHRLDDLLDAKDDALRDLRDQLEHMRRESERKDAIIMQLSQTTASLSARVLEIESPETPDTSATGSEDTPPVASSEPRSWWRRFFGFE